MSRSSRPVGAGSADRAEVAFIRVLDPTFRLGTLGRVHHPARRDQPSPTDTVRPQRDHAAPVTQRTTTASSVATATLSPTPSAPTSTSSTPTASIYATSPTNHPGARRSPASRPDRSIRSETGPCAARTDVPMQEDFLSREDLNAQCDGAAGPLGEVRRHERWAARGHSKGHSAAVAVLARHPSPALRHHGGHTRRATFPMMDRIGTGPNERESTEPRRWSPSKNTVPWGTRTGPK